MTNALNKLIAAFLKGLAQYSYGCVCYNLTGMSPRASDEFILSLRAADEDSYSF